MWANKRQVGYNKVKKSLDCINTDTLSDNISQL